MQECDNEQGEDNVRTPNDSELGPRFDSKCFGGKSSSPACALGLFEHPHSADLAISCGIVCCRL